MTLVSQGFIGALEQYWSINPKPRLERKNTYFDDAQMTNAQALRVGIVVATLGIGVVGFWCLLGAIL